MKTFGQFIKFLILGLVATIVEWGVFALCNYNLFQNLADIPFSWFIFDYPVEFGGLSMFLATVLSFTAAQITNFIVQRKFTFKAEGNVVYSAIMYTVMVLLSYAYIMWVPSVFSPLLMPLLGAEFTAMGVKILSQFTCCLIQFPFNKFIIMK